MSDKKWIRLDCKQPHKNQWCEVAWTPNGKVEHTEVGRWDGEGFAAAGGGFWTPTHWRSIQKPEGILA